MILLRERALVYGIAEGHRLAFYRRRVLEPPECHHETPFGQLYPGSRYDLAASYGPGGASPRRQPQRQHAGGLLDPVHVSVVVGGTYPGELLSGLQVALGHGHDLGRGSRQGDYGRLAVDGGARNGDRGFQAGEMVGSVEHVIWSRALSQVTQRLA